MSVDQNVLTDSQPILLLLLSNVSLIVVPIYSRHRINLCMLIFVAKWPLHHDFLVLVPSQKPNQFFGKKQ